MPKSTQRILGVISLVLAALSFFFLFCNLLWDSSRGLQLSFSFPVNWAASPLALLSDLCYLLAPLGAVLQALLFLLGKKKEKGHRLLLLSAVPMGLYSLLQLLILIQKELHFYELFTAGFLLFLAVLAFFSAFYREYLPFVGFFSLFYVILETLLAGASFLFKKKLSYFCFTQLIPTSRTTYFRFSYAVISVFLVFTLFALALALFALAQRKPKEKKKTEPPAKPEPEGAADKVCREEPEEEEDEEEEIPLSLEDLGIER